MIPAHPSLDNREGPRGDSDRALPVEQLHVSTAVVIGQTLTASLAAYAFSFLIFRGRQVLFFLFLSTLMIPWEATIIPTT